MLYAAWWWATAIFLGVAIFTAYAMALTVIVSFLFALFTHLSEKRTMKRRRRKNALTEKELENWQIH